MRCRCRPRAGRRWPMGLRATALSPRSARGHARRTWPWPALRPSGCGRSWRRRETGSTRVADCRSCEHRRCWLTDWSWAIEPWVPAAGSPQPKTDEQNEQTRNSGASVSAQSAGRGLSRTHERAHELAVDLRPRSRPRRCQCPRRTPGRRRSGRCASARCRCLRSRRPRASRGTPRSSSAPATQPIQSSMLRRIAAGTSPRTTTSETAKRPPGFSTRKASASTRSLSADEVDDAVRDDHVHASCRAAGCARSRPSGTRHSSSPAFCWFSRASASISSVMSRP